MKTKRFLCLLLTLMMLASTLVISVFASSVIVSGDWGGGSPEWKITSDGTLTLTGSGYIQGSSTGEYPWLQYKSEVTRIVIDDRITTIPSGCFYGMSRVTSVKLGNALETIGPEAFRGCSALTSISIPASVKTIDSGAFFKCSNLQSVTFAQNPSLTELGGSAFQQTALVSIDIPEGITTINTGTFSDCASLQSITFPDSLTAIRNLAFEDCDSLTSLTIPAGLSNIAIEAFRFCPNLTHLELYRNVNYQDHFRYNSIESIVVRHDLDTFSGFGHCQTLTSVQLPDTVKTIKSGAFRYCSSLKTIDWPASLTTIESDAFNGSGLTEVALPDTVTEVGTGAFRYCSNLTSFRSNDKVNEIPSQFAQDCPNLTDVDLGRATSVGTEAFANCTSLIKIELPNTLESISDRAFQSCTALEGIVIPASVNKLGFSVFSQCKALKAVYFLGSAPEIGSYIFMYDTLDAYYPAGDDSWTDEVKQQYGGTVTWIESDYSDIAPTAEAAATAFGTIELKWNPLPASARYHVYRATAADGEYAQIATVTDAHYVDADIEVGSTYYYYVVSESAKGVMSSPSSTVSGTARQDAPVVTASNVVKTGKVRLTWKAIDGAVGYKVYRATSKTGTYSLMYTAKSTSYTNTSATAGRYYYYQVVAVDQDGNESAPSAIVGRTCDLSQPDISVSNVPKTGKVRITWPKVTGAVQYKVYRATSKNGSYSLMKTLTSTTYTNTNAEAGKSYYYKVVAVAEKSAANSTSVVKHRTVDLPQVQPSIALNAKGKPTVTWKAVEGAVSYKVYRATSKNGSYSLMKTLTSTTYVNTNIVSGSTYYYKVVAVCSNTAGNSAASPIVSITCR